MIRKRLKSSQEVRYDEDMEGLVKWSLTKMETHRISFDLFVHFKTYHNKINKVTIS